MGENSEKCVVKVGSRKSELALIQTRYVISQLKSLYPDLEFDIVTMTTLGDRVLNISLPKIGEKSLFTKDLEQALECGSVDMVVHSLKDLPTTLPDNMAIGAVLEREDPRDALVLREDFKGHTLATLPPGSIIGTSSLRRTAQVSRNHPHLKVVDIRGNLNTRLKKLDYHYLQKSSSNTNICEKSQDSKSVEQNGRTSNQNGGTSNQNGGKTNQNDGKSNQNGGKSNQNGGGDNSSKASNGNSLEISDAINLGPNFVDGSCPDYSALILAQAGLVRMGWQHRISQVLPCKEVLYAVGQGALAIECRANNDKILKMLAPLNHPDTYCRILAERSFLKTLGGGCSAPVAIATTLKQAENSTADAPRKRFKITGAVWSLNGKTKIQESLLDELDCKGKTCPFTNKSKAVKHKMNDVDIEDCIDVSGSKISKTESVASSSCSQEKFSVGEMKDFQNVNCCRMKTMNMTVNKAEPVEIENLINIHGKLFMSCPFSLGVKGVCPVEFSVGQEVLGECPYLSETEKEFTQTLVKMHPRKVSYDIKKCPFMSNQVVAINASMSTSTLDGNGPEMVPYDVNSEPKAKNCPFLKQNDSAQMTSVENHSSSSDQVKLYCGLTKHFDLPETIIEKCENLGKQLANKLIDNGALEVMHCAQEFIRSTVSHSVVAK